MSKLKGNSNVVSYENHQVIPHKGGIGWDILIQMEHLTPLNEYTRKHTITRQDVIKLGIDLCKALELCQKYNIIHRDVKPENIFISDAGDFKLGILASPGRWKRPPAAFPRREPTPTWPRRFIRERPTAPRWIFIPWESCSTVC